MSSATEGLVKRTDRLRADLVDQGRRVQAMLEAAFDALFSGSDEAALGVLKQDDVIDGVDVAMEQACVQLLVDATRAGAELEPMHLRTVLTIVKVNNELERIADAAVDVAEMVPLMKGAAGNFPPTFRVMANSVVGILRDANSSIQQNNPQLAKVVLQSQHAVAAFKSALLRDAEEQIAKGQMSVDTAFRLHELASQCEMMADHCTNIAEQLIYLTTGAIVRHTENSWVEVACTLVDRK